MVWSGARHNMCNISIFRNCSRRFCCFRNCQGTWRCPSESNKATWWEQNISSNVSVRSDRMLCAVFIHTVLERINWFCFQIKAILLVSLSALVLTLSELAVCSCFCLYIVFVATDLNTTFSCRWIFKNVFVIMWWRAQRQPFQTRKCFDRQLVIRRYRALLSDNFSFW